MIDLSTIKEFREWVITKAQLSASLCEEFKDNNNEKVYAEGSLGAYHDVRIELDRLILTKEEE